MTSHASAAGGSYTWDDFIALEEDDLRELIDGELVEVEVPTRSHERIVVDLVTELRLWTRRHGGEILASGYADVFRPESFEGLELPLATPFVDAG